MSATASVGALMHRLFAKSAFQSSSKREAYSLKCDAEATLQSDIDRGVVNVVVGAAPLKPAEFAAIQTQHLASQNQI